MGPGSIRCFAIGLCYLVVPRAKAAAPVSGSERLAPGLCLAGLLGATIYMAVGYVVCNLIWPNFYFAHVETGKDVWLAGQLIGIVIYFYGIIVAFDRLRHNHLASDAVVVAAAAARAAH